MPSTLLLLFGSSHFTNGRDFQSNWCFFLLSTGIMNPLHRTQTCDTSLNATHVPEFFIRRFFFPLVSRKTDLKKLKTRKWNNFKVYISVMLEMLDFWWHYYYNYLLLLLLIIIIIIISPAFPWTKCSISESIFLPVKMLSTYYLPEYKKLKLNSICKAHCKVIGKKQHYK